jgi:hypothetical protein
VASKILNIDDDAHQRHTLQFGTAEIALSLRYHPTVEMWTMDVAYQGQRALGYKLSVGVLHMRSRNFPFDFVVGDNSNQGLDPIRRDDFVSGRCSLYLLDADDMENLRGAPVPV